jgi:hypothetical protein
MSFREHRGSFEDSMETLCHFDSRSELILYCAALLSQYDFRFERDQFHEEPYCIDPGHLDMRVEPPWNTHIVTIDGYGVMGFTDGPC